MMSPPPPHPLLYEPINRQADFSDLRLVLRLLVTPRQEEAEPGTPPSASPTHPTCNDTPPLRRDSPCHLARPAARAATAQVACHEG